MLNGQTLYAMRGTIQTRLKKKCAVFAMERNSEETGDFLLRKGDVMQGFLKLLQGKNSCLNRFQDAMVKKQLFKTCFIAVNVSLKL